MNGEIGRAASCSAADEVGTLKELNVKEGDVVEFYKPAEGWEDCNKFICKVYTINKYEDASGQAWSMFYNDSPHQFKLISRKGDKDMDSAATEVKPFGQLTPEEKGALLLAHHEGKVIEIWCTYKWAEVEEPTWTGGFKYRVKQEPVREVVEVFGGLYNVDQWMFGSQNDPCDTHRITFETIDGEPVLDSVKMFKV